MRFILVNFLVQIQIRVTTRKKLYKKMKMREKWVSKDRIKPKKLLRILKPSLRMRKPSQTKICLELKSIYLDDSIIFF